MRPSPANAGFTLIEVLAALMVMSLVAAVAMPLLRRTPAQPQLKAEASRMAGALRVTRAAAMAQNHEMVFRIDPAQRAYGSPVIPVSVMDRGVEVELAVAAGERSAAGGLIRFYPSGRSSGGNIRLRLEQAEARLGVVWATGHVALVD